MLDTLDFTIRIGSTPTFLYFDLYLYSAYAAHYVYFIVHSASLPGRNANVTTVPGKNTNVASLPGKNTNVASLPEKNNYSLALSLPERPYLKKLAPVLIQDRDECSMIVNFKAVP